MSIEHRVIVVTGVTRGLGRAMAEAFAAGGHRVAGCGRDRGALDEVATELGIEDHFWQPVDLADGAQVEAWGRAVEARLGVPDLVINNAAVINRNAPLWEVPGEEIESLFRINLAGVCHVLRAFLPAMVERRRGVVVNFSSGWGRSTAPEVAPYCASKWGIEGLTRALAQELPPGMAAVPFNPGIIHTEMLASCFGPAAASYPGPEEWARRAVPRLLAFGPDDNGEARSL
ncbi:MAG: SDR family NAD(P)-dependent oxidoreductase [Acidobacteriota bacterium]